MQCMVLNFTVLVSSMHYIPLTYSSRGRRAAIIRRAVIIRRAAIIRHSHPCGSIHYHFSGYGVTQCDADTGIVALRDNTTFAHCQREHCVCVCVCVLCVCRCVCVCVLCVCVCVCVCVCCVCVGVCVCVCVWSVCVVWCLTIIIHDKDVSIPIHS